MQNIIIEKPYRFIPPHPGTWLPTIFRTLGFHSWQIKRSEGVISHECRHLERLRASIAAGLSVLVTPNHSRTADPLAMGWVSRETPTSFWAMASWHLFCKDWLSYFIIKWMGAFSVNREGIDRQALETAIDLLAQGKRPLVIFPEGSTSRTNDRLQPLLEGVAFIARAAAKKKIKENPAGKVVIHPIAIKYLFRGDIQKSVDETLTKLETRLSWQPQSHLPLIPRIIKMGQALLTLKELEYMGIPQTGSLAERLEGLRSHLLAPLEREWLGSEQKGPAVPRVKGLRQKILPTLIAGDISATERARRQQQLAQLYLAQQLASYYPDYLEKPTAERLLELVEKYEEDVYDKATRHGHLHAILDVGEALDVPEKRERGSTSDPLMVELEKRLQGMLDELALESTPYEEPPVQPADRITALHSH